ncbi:MAG TPA: phytanoyl-CoA dioxygenase family protein [Polyangiaceae bacterium]|nr:phytanoyl-CoA dioxygenase family protein [Polyangiaceae bacterium]
MDTSLIKPGEQRGLAAALPPRTRWWQSPLICRHINRKICGKELDGTDGGDVDLLRQLSQGRSYARAVSVGCGNAYHQLRLLESGLVKSFVLYEQSEARAAQAAARAKAMGLSERVTLRVRDASSLPVEPGFELVYWKDALHHLADIQAAVRWSHDVLSPGGLFFMNDFVGPTHMQFTERQLDLAEQIRRALPERFLRDPENPGKMVPLRPTRAKLANQLEASPATSAHASNLLPALKSVFPDITVLPTGGICYMLALEGILANIREVEDEAVLRAMLLADNLCIEAGESLHAVAHARREQSSVAQRLPIPAASKTPTSAAQRNGTAKATAHLTSEDQLTNPLWLDLPDAERQLNRKLERGELDSEEAEMLREYVRTGYIMVDVPGLDHSIRDLLQGVERLWRHPPFDLAGAGHVNGGRPLPLSELAPLVERGPGVRILDLHSHVDGARQLYLNSRLHRLCGLILGGRAVATQSLYFQYGSTQSLHRDPWYVNHNPRTHLVAAWFALEDIVPEAGPLMYVPGSHTLPYYRFSTGDVVFHDPAVTNDDRVAALAHMQAQMQERGLRAEPALPRRGQVFLWHGSLIHGGSPVKNPSLTRQSFVVHYGREDTHLNRGSGFQRNGKSRVFFTQAKYTSDEGTIGFHNPIAGMTPAEWGDEPGQSAVRPQPEAARPQPEAARPQSEAVRPQSPPRTQPQAPTPSAHKWASARADKLLRKLRKAVNEPGAFLADSGSPTLQRLGARAVRIEEALAQARKARSGG